MITSLIDLFYPKVCAGCTTFLLEYEYVICTKCRHEIPLTNHHLNPDNEAVRKFYGKVPVVTAVTFMYYHKQGTVQHLIHSLKYKGAEEIGEAIGKWYAADLIEFFAEKPHEIIPVPLHKRRLKERGYNQVITFASAIAQKLDIPLNEKLLVRSLYSKTQTRKNLLGRTEVGRNLFDVNFSDQDHSKHFLLVDDVLTTGSTLEACSNALLKIPGARISIVCMAMSHS